MCNKCWNNAVSSDAAFVHIGSSDNKWAQWTPELLKNGKWAFKSHTGKYLARCDSCARGASYSNFAFVHVDSPNDKPWAQWTVSFAANLNLVAKFPIGNINIQADSGKYLARCNNCGPAKLSDSASIYIIDPTEAVAIWTVIQVGDKVALKSDNGKYLVTCRDCWNDSDEKDAAFIHKD